jgi:hypothetical protein
MFSEDLRDHLPVDRKVLVVIGVALLIVITMAAIVITWGNVTASSTDFRDDCEKLGGQVHELGDDTLCMVKDQVIGRQ